MANTRIKDISTAATTLNSDDFIAVDGSTAGTRKMAKADLITEVSTGVSGTYLEESNNLSDVASKDTSKLNLEVPNVGSSANEVSLNGQLGTMAFQDSAGVSVEQLEAETLTVDSNGSTQPTQSVVTNAGAEGSALELRNSAISASTATALTFTNSTISGANYGKAKIAAVRTNEANGNTDVVISTSSSGSLSEAVRIDSSQRVGVGTAEPDRALHCYSSSVATVLKLDSGGADTGLEFAHSDTVAAGINCSTGGDLEFRTGGNSGGNEAVRIDSSGRLGVNQSTPGNFNAAADDLVIGDSSGDRGITISTGDSSNGYIVFGDATSGANMRGRLAYDHSADQLYLGAGGATNWKIDGATGNFVRVTAGAGIDFDPSNSTSGVTVSASSVLDSYEVGLWTPVVADAVSGGNTATVGTAQGRYTRVGRIVQFSCLVANIDTTGLTAGYGLYIQGLPFPGVAVSSWKPMTVMMDTITFSGQVVGIIGQNESAIRFKQFSSGAADSDVLVSAVSSSSADIHVQGVYEVV